MPGEPGKPEVCRGGDIDPPTDSVTRSGECGRRPVACARTGPEARVLDEVDCSLDFDLSSSCFFPSFQKSRLRGLEVPSFESEGWLSAEAGCADLLNRGALEPLDSALAAPSSGLAAGSIADISRNDWTKQGISRFQADCKHPTCCPCRNE